MFRWQQRSLVPPARNENASSVLCEVLGWAVRGSAEKCEPLMQVEADGMEEEFPRQSDISARNSTSVSKLLLHSAAQYLKTPLLSFFPMLLLP